MHCHECTVSNINIERLSSVLFLYPPLIETQNAFKTQYCIIVLNSVTCVIIVNHIMNTTDENIDTSLWELTLSLDDKKIKIKNCK